MLKFSSGVTGAGGTGLVDGSSSTWVMAGLRECPANAADGGTLGVDLRNSGVDGGGPPRESKGSSSMVVW